MAFKQAQAWLSSNATGTFAQHFASSSATFASLSHFSTFTPTNELDVSRSNSRQGYKFEREVFWDQQWLITFLWPKQAKLLEESDRRPPGWPVSAHCWQLAADNLPGAAFMSRDQLHSGRTLHFCQPEHPYTRYQLNDVTSVLLAS